MNARKPRQEFGVEQPQQASNANRTQCVANGCPLVAAWIDANGTRICPAHDGVPASRWGLVTTRARSRTAVERAVLTLTNACPIDSMPGAVYAMAIQSLGEGAKWQASDRNSVKIWAIRVHGMLIGEFRKGLEGPAFDVARQLPDSWQKPVLDDVGAV